MSKYENDHFILTKRSTKVDGTPDIYKIEEKNSKTVLELKYAHYYDADTDSDLFVLMDIGGNLDAKWNNDSMDKLRAIVYGDDFQSLAACLPNCHDDQVLSAVDALLGVLMPKEEDTSHNDDKNAAIILGWKK